VIDQTKGGEKGGILVHSNTSATKWLRAQDLISDVKNDPLAGASTLNF
jgi:hypothetical protein